MVGFLLLNLGSNVGLTLDYKIVQKMVHIK